MDATGLEDRVMVVTGGTRGIGREITLEAARRGARVVCCARDVARGGPEVEAEAALGRGRVVATQADVSSEADVVRLFETARAAFGPVDIAINNAGTSSAALLVNHTVAEWDRVMATNVRGSLLVARELIRGARADGRPAVLVSIGSIAQEGSANNASYTASKGALLGMTQGLAREHPDLRANLVVAGYVETELSEGMNPRTKAFCVQYSAPRRAGTRAEVAGAALFLASDRSRHLNGQALLVTGGLLQCPA